MTFGCSSREVLSIVEGDSMGVYLNPKRYTDFIIILFNNARVLHP